MNFRNDATPMKNCLGTVYSGAEPKKIKKKINRYISPIDRVDPVVPIIISLGTVDMTSGCRIPSKADPAAPGLLRV
jgi:hypothetical protein